MVMQMGSELRHMMLMSETARIQGRIEDIGCELRERLRCAARDLRAEAEKGGAAPNLRLLGAARRLDDLARAAAP